jgi:outer membrane biosynthesis protein TonB
LRTDWTISACCHAVVLGTALVSFAPTRLPATNVESIPVNIVTDTTTSEMTKGMPTLPKLETPKQFVEKIDQPKAVDNPAAKIAPKEVTASTDVTPPPAPPEPKREAEKKKAEPKRDLIAEALKKDDAKKTEQKKADAKKADAKVPTPPKRPPTPQDQPKFDPREMQALLDKRTPQRKEATGNTISDTAALGTAKGKAQQLTQNEMDALRRHLVSLWNPPIGGVKDLKEIEVVIRFQLKPDGTLAGAPRVMSSGQSPQFMAARDAAIRAVFRGQPFSMLRPETYEEWRDLLITFDAAELERG